MSVVIESDDTCAYTQIGTVVKIAVVHTVPYLKWSGVTASPQAEQTQSPQKNDCKVCPRTPHVAHPLLSDHL